MPVYNTQWKTNWSMTVLLWVRWEGSCHYTLLYYFLQKNTSFYLTPLIFTVLYYYYYLPFFPFLPGVSPSTRYWLAFCCSAGLGHIYSYLLMSGDICLRLTSNSVISCTPVYFCLCLWPVFVYLLRFTPTLLVYLRWLCIITALYVCTSCNTDWVTPLLLLL